MSTETQAGTFPAHVHEIVGLAKRDARIDQVEASIDSMTLGVEEESALWRLASSLHTGARLDQAAGGLAGRAPAAGGSAEVRHARRTSTQKEA